MSRNPSTNVWITVDDGCPLSYEVNGSGAMEFVCGSSAADGIGMTIQSEALRKFVALGTEALREMDALFADEQAKEDQTSAA
ncbi:hypothetical protein JOF56_001830 [Kibdelosporangium banguiense]|uniref:Uncharacterized protein n=1 Tax=Kibdelosporangium banguiense TaxID=1365924 RepID=A0ABS4TAJ4_9PSEU|nr:hypothetical protein [Kibdelosporangium banguiense]MBP2321445.1 hypothetical protein [Kibdelosporangium banguiense]